MEKYYVYVMCNHMKDYRWVVRCNCLYTALQSCNRKRANGVDSFVSTRNDIGGHGERIN